MNQKQILRQSMWCKRVFTFYSYVFTNWCDCYCDPYYTTKIIKISLLSDTQNLLDNYKQVNCLKFCSVLFSPERKEFFVAFFFFNKKWQRGADLQLLHGDGLRGEGVVSNMLGYNKRHLFEPPRSPNFPVAPQAAAEQTEKKEGIAD